MIKELINRYKRIRTEHYLRQTYKKQYAFVGMGNHSLTNLYPVLYYLGVPLKYICVTSTRKAKLIEQKFPNVKAKVSLDEILKDKDVKAVFVSVSPKAHFSIASKVLQSGKSLFIEKPPCQTSEELETLIEIQQLHGPSVAMVGWQKRYAPAIQLLKKRLRKEHLISYDLHYLTGAYPEGNALLELYTHPLDLVCFLFGKPDVLTVRHVAKDSYILMLQHPHIVGTLELSTSYTWNGGTETLKVNTKSGCYQMREMEELTFEPSHLSIFGIPTEKIYAKNKTVEYLFQNNGFSPIMENNLVYTQGFYSEIESFVSLVEKGKNEVSMELKSVRDTYDLLRVIQTEI